ncbi:unnamed protein product [Bemisia tabaci]|uniref:Uncharacterized protein n=1 Tax=Bemisia tabaci TaxID=7038 RepID=A0A9P0CCW8_BEMTA|nr:unnamed protein product [Bemisia tabaci]
MVIADLKQLELVWALLLFLILRASGEDEGVSQNLERRMFFRFGRFRRTGVAQQNPVPPAVKENIDQNICAEFEPYVWMGPLNPKNVREQRKCQAAAQYLFASDARRPDDCGRYFGARCAQEGNNKFVCVVRVWPSLFPSAERPLSYCAQNFNTEVLSKPKEPTPQPKPQPIPEPKPESNPQPRPQPLRPPTPADDPDRTPNRGPLSNDDQKPADDRNAKPADNRTDKPVDDGTGKPNVEGASNSGDPTKIPVDDPTKTPAADDPTKTPAADDPTKTPAADDPTKTPAADDPTRRPGDNDPTRRPDDQRTP